MLHLLQIKPVFLCQTANSNNKSIINLFYYYKYSIFHDKYLNEFYLKLQDSMGIAISLKLATVLYR